MSYDYSGSINTAYAILLFARHYRSYAVIFSLYVNYNRSFEDCNLPANKWFQAVKKINTRDKYIFCLVRGLKAAQVVNHRRLPTVVCLDDYSDVRIDLSG